MTVASSTAPPAPVASGPAALARCVRCGAENDAGRPACNSCLSPLTASGALDGLERPIWIPWRRLTGGTFACMAAVTVALYAPRLFPPPPTPSKPAAPTVTVTEHPGMVAVPVIQREGLGKYEPAEGCFIGAFVSQDINIDGSMTKWEETTGKGHASYLRYVGYGQPFPKEWVADVRRVGAVPNIAFEPNAGLKKVKENDYLHQWARDAAESGGPVFLRFASEMNGDWTAYHGNPARYRLKFRTVARVMHAQAPNVAMVWTPYCLPTYNLRDYYPGDEAVDWVGVNIYSVHHHNGRADRPADWEDPTRLLNQVYRRYADKKPIQVSEFASTHVCAACGQDTPDFAIRKMKQMYDSLPKRFPRVKMIYWFSWDTIAGGAAENNYSVCDDPDVLRAYQLEISKPYYLPRIPEGEYYTFRPRAEQTAAVQTASR